MRELLLIFSVADQLYGLPARTVQEIVLLPQLSTVPGQPRILHGFLHLRGEAVPVVDMRALFAQPAQEPDLYAPVIVMQSQPTLALLADEVLDVREPGASELRPVSPDSSVNECAAAQWHSDAGTVTVLSAARLLLAQERERLLALRDQVEQRAAECRSGLL